jgi:hypothetical protein
VTDLEDSLRDYYASRADDLDLPPRVFDGDLPHDVSVSYISIGPEPRRRTPILLAAAASIALIAGAGVLVTHGSPSRGPVVVSNATTTVASPAEMAVFAATWLPEGYVLTGASDISDTPEGYSHLLIYRDRSQPAGSPAIFIAVGASQTNYGGSEITVQGRTAWDFSNEKDAAIAMTDPSGVGVTLTGHHIDMAQLREIAETVSARSTDPGDGVNISGLPPGFEKVAELGGAMSSRQVDLEYSRPGSPDSPITVEVSNVDPAFEEILGAMADSPLTPMTVRGHNGFHMRITAPRKQSTLAWKETTESLVAVFSPDVTPEVLLKVAEGLKTITSDELKQILSTMPEPTGRSDGFNASDHAPSPPAAFTCADHDSTGPQGQRTATCSDRYRPILWPTWLPDGFALATIERATGAPSDRWMLQFTNGAPSVDGVSDILLTIDAPSPNGLAAFQSLATSPPMNARVVQTTIRGHDAIIVSDPTGQNHSVGIAWMETPLLFVELESSRVSVFLLRQMAERLGPFSTDDWNAKLARNQLLLGSVTTAATSVVVEAVPTSTTKP